MTAIVVFWSAWFLIFYAYVLFPLALAILARICARRSAGDGDAPADPEPPPRVALVIAAYNEAAVLAKKLANTWAIDYPPDRLQLFIGSDGSSDATDSVLAACPDPRLQIFAFAERRGKISVLNDLIARTDAEIVVMSDANTMFAPDALRRLIRHFQDPRVGCVSGELSLEQAGGSSGEGLYWKYEGWIKRNESRLGFLIGCNGGIYAFRRALYAPLPASTIVEDFVLTLRLIERGYRVVFEPSARATEPPCPTPRAEMMRKARIGAGGFQALGLTYPLLHPRYGLRAFAYWGHKVLRWCVPLLFLAALVANAALATERFYLYLLLIQAGCGGIAWQAYRRQRGMPRWTRPISYFYLMNYALFCGFLRFLFGTQRVTWDRASR